MTCVHCGVDESILMEYGTITVIETDDIGEKETHVFCSYSCLRRWFF
jgi:hypothetical protein